MAAKVCPSCGLKNPSSSMRCDCGDPFGLMRDAPRTCPDCDTVWMSRTPRCRCGSWLDEEARAASARLADKLTQGWLTLTLGVALLVIPLLGPPLGPRFGLMWLIAGVLLVQGLHAIANAHHGLRMYAAPRRSRAARLPQARVVVRR